MIDRSLRLLFIIQTIVKYPGNYHPTVPRGNLFLILLLLLFFNSIGINGISVPPRADVAIVADDANAIASAYYLLMCPIVTIGYFSNLERKSGVSKGVCMTDCANDRTLRSCFRETRDCRARRNTAFNLFISAGSKRAGGSQFVR